MKIDNERPYHSNVFHEIVPGGGPKIDCEPETETKQNLLEDKMVKQKNSPEHTFVKAEHQNGGKTRQIRIEDVSYDKDVVEINLPDAVVSSYYGGNFVKDVCIDEGVLADQKTSGEKVESEKVFPNFDSSTGNENAALMEEIGVDPLKTAHMSQIVTLHVAHATDGNNMEEIRVEPVKIAHEVKTQIVTLHDASATDGNTTEQYSPCEVRDLEDNKNNGFTNLNVEKLSPTQLSSHEAAKQCQQKSTVISEQCQQKTMVISETYENHKPFCVGEAIDEVASNDCYEIGASIALEANNLNDLPVESTSNGFSAAIPEEDIGTELDEQGLNPASHYNPFIAYGSLEDTWEPKYTLPTIVDDVSVVPICPVGKTDSFSDLVNGGALRGLDFVETAESRIGDSRSDSVGARSSRLVVEPSEVPSEESLDQRGSLVERTDSFSDLVNGGAGGFDPILTDETKIKHSRLDSIEESSGRLDVQASEEINDQREDLVNEMRTEGAHGTGTSGADPKSDDHPECETDTFEDAHDFNPRDMEDGTNVMEDKKDSKSSRLAQTESLVQRNGPDSGRLLARTGMRNPFESSFSGASITLDTLAPSAHIGNTSLRSDSSTTSTRSFAFPVLQTEWNSSPVKMAKADRRRDRGWGYRVLCCKF
uniref:Uncharacterized protein n=3 Tax=Avena sativa TaxID=4498 RepID=A0ACD5UB47_AVESA